jgi:large subunit ribosomal protein L29
MLKASGIREQTEDELRELCRETAKHLQTLRLHRGGGEGSEHPIRMRTLRRELARIKTVMRERGIREHG